MIDERFSKEAFEALGWDSAAARELCGKLVAEIHVQLVSVMRPVMLNIVEQLNGLGHELADVSKAFGDDLHFRDPADSVHGGHKTVVAADLVVSVGYPEPWSECPVDWDEGDVEGR